MEIGSNEVPFGVATRRSTRVKRPNIPYSPPILSKPTKAKRKRLAEEEVGEGGGEGASEQIEGSIDEGDDQDSSEESPTEDEDEGERDEQGKKNDQRRKSAASRGVRSSVSGRVASTRLKRRPIKKNGDSRRNSNHEGYPSTYAGEC
jgi:hypothetical protein